MEDDPLTDEVLTQVTRTVVRLVTREHPLSGNQLFDLASHLNRIATHRIVEERIRRARSQPGT